MIHYLTLGHLDPEAVRRGQTVVLHPLDQNIVQKLLREVGEINEQGETKLGGLPVEIKEDLVRCPWLMPGHNLQTEAFACRLVQETGCLMADVKSRKIVTTEAFAASPYATKNNWDSAQQTRPFSAGLED